MEVSDFYLVLEKGRPRLTMEVTSLDVGGPGRAPLEVSHFDFAAGSSQISLAGRPLSKTP